LNAKEKLSNIKRTNNICPKIECKNTNRSGFLFMDWC